MHARRFSIVLFLASWSLHASPLVLKPDLERQSPTRLEALMGDYKIEEVMRSTEWKPASNNFGYVERPLWVRMRVQAERPADYVWMTDAFARELHVYIVHEGQTTMFDLGVAERLAMENRFMRPVLPVHVEAGETDFYFEIRSDTSIQFTSDFLTPDAYQEHRELMVFLYSSFFGALFLMAFYNLFVYLSTREASYRSYITYALSAFLYFLSQSGMLLMFAPLSEGIVMRFHLVVLGPYVIFMCLFCRSFLGSVLKDTWWDRALVAVMVVAGCLVPPALAPVIPFAAVAQPGSVVVLIALALVLSAGIAAWIRGYRPARYYVLSLGAFVAGAVLLALRQVALAPHNLLTSHAVQLGTLAEMALLAFALSDRINMLRKDAESKMTELAAANAELERSEAKYRSIFEDTTDLVFTLDPAGRFLSINNAAYRTIGYQPGELEGREVFSLIPSAGSMDLQSVLLRDALANTETSQRFRLQLSGRDGSPVNVSVKIERVITSHGFHFQGRAFLSSADPLMHCLRRERLSYSVDNYFATAELLNQRITRNLPAFFSDEECIDLQVVLREMLVNAIEHGNLEISFEQKTEAQKDGNYLQYAAARQKRSEYAGRRIHVISSLSPEYVLYHIEDEGPGFDHVNVARRALQGVSDLTLSHGRGIAISRQLLDRVTYNSRGNAVTLLKETRKTP